MASLRQPRPPFSSPSRLKTTASLPLHQSALLPFPSAIRPSSRRAQGRGFGTSLPEGKKQKAEKSSSCEINKTVEKGEDDEIPEEVFDRMTKRILLYIGAPVASGLGLLCALSLLKERGIWEVPEWLPFFIISVSFGSLGLGGCLWDTFH
ncbi:Uncharacterized protein PAM68-like [Apostasia shenzhenica]|uniref:Uncharacterized protein PAM68-like n=1 Tax=Apostasia shenzhenica TaxID=1088818 RepID=A0A2I0AK95_9ASPA|nr:Uncharacterized protein PAM68-like [Apostasia shenzhenica]